MFELGGKRILLGGFHDHWWRADPDNPTLLLAALGYYHYDFVTLMDGPEYLPPLVAAAETFSDRIRLYPGREHAYSMMHVVTVGADVPDLSSGTENDYEKALLQLRDVADLVCLAHPDYPDTWETLYLTGEMDRLMDQGIIDGINLINTDGFDAPRHQELIDWYRRRDAAGKHTPIVGGWDAHL